jgi:glycosyltransferase involved in cell wall biosynthesis
MQFANSTGGGARRIVVSAVTDFATSNAASIHASELARAFATLGHEVRLVVPRPRGALGPAEDLAAAGVTLDLFAPISRKLPSAANHLAQGARLAALVRRFRPDLVYLRSTPVGFAVAGLLRGIGIGRIVTEHNGWLEDEVRALGYPAALSPLVRACQILDARLAHKARVITPEIGHLLEHAGIPASKLLRIGNGTNLAHFRALERTAALRAMGLPEDRAYLGFIGNLAPWQGVDVLIDAFARLSGELPNWELLVAGDGPQRAALERRANEAGIAARVRFLGGVRYAEAPTVVSAFDIAVAPFARKRNSRIGLSPLKIRDYAACARPVVAADIAGVRELAPEGWLALHQPDDADDLAGVLAPLMRDPSRRADMGERARAYAEAHFGWGMVARRILAGALGP